MGHAADADGPGNAGVSDWAGYLRRQEEIYSGSQTRVRRVKVSPHDPRLLPEMDAKCIPGNMLSGARFIEGTGYAEIYASRLCPLAESRIVLVEMGVLLGAGLAVWCDVFPTSRVIGLDIDLRRFSVSSLRERGAFEFNTPETYFYDELAIDAAKRLQNLLRGERIDAMIDDALHDDASIMKAMAVFLPFMADKFLYFIEDNGTVDELIREMYPQFDVMRSGRLTVVSNG